jgi:TatD DNase family protein
MMLIVRNTALYAAPLPSVIDVHAHLNEVPEVREALETARENGVKAVVGVGMDTKSNKHILELAQMFPGFVFPAIGIHPWNINSETLESDLTFVSDHLSECVAVGEIGLDYKIKVPKAVQKYVFQKLLSLAHLYHKPVITHSRLSHQRTLEMVAEAGVEGAIFHWYSGPLELVDKIALYGYLISATPALAYSHPHQEAIKRIPLDNLVLETDCPVEYGPLKSRPEHTRVTLELVARLKGEDFGTIARMTTHNAEKIFGISSEGQVTESS